MEDLILFIWFITFYTSAIGLCGYIIFYYKNGVFSDQTELCDLIQNKIDSLSEEQRRLDESSSKMTALTGLLKALPPTLQKLEKSLKEKNQCRVKDDSVVVADDENDGNGDDEVSVSSLDSDKKKKKRRRVKKKVVIGENGDEVKCGAVSLDVDVDVNVKDEMSLEDEGDLVWKYPFTTCSSPMQRKIKQQFDQLVKCCDSKKMSLAQIGRFADCLIQAREELQHKTEQIKRKFILTKALLFRADRSSVDRLSQQLQKLEMERKRLQDDALVYNVLQQQLKLSPSYKKMLEVSASLDKLKAKPEDYLESADPDFPDISFEEFLAKEKKDSFWQKNGRVRSNSS